MLTRFILELRRRGVIKVTVGYVLLALGLLEGVDIIAEALFLPPATVRWTLWALVAGFPIAATLSWRYDLTAEGLARADSQGTLLARLRDQPATSVAVLPFLDLSKDRDQAYFGDGIAAEISAAFSAVEGLGVASLTSAFALRGTKDMRAVAESLGVDAVLTGSVQRTPTDVRIVTELVDGGTGTVLWSGQYKRAHADVIDIQEDIAREVLGHLEGALGGPTPATPTMRPHSPDPEAYELYLQARYFWTRRHEVGLDRSIEFYERAIRVDPSYALAHAGLADVFMFKGFYLIEEPRAAFERARRSIERAFRHAADQAEVHRAQGMMRLWYEWDISGAEASFRRALELDPSDSLAPLMYGQLLAATGRRDEARGLAEHGLRLDPTSPAAVGLAAVVYAINRDSDRAIELAESVLAREPVNFLSRYIAGTAHIGKGTFARAVEHLELAADTSRRNPLIVAFLAQAHARNGDETAARSTLATLAAVPDANYPHAAHAAALASLGDLESVGPGMERGIARHEPYLFIAASAPVFDPLRSHPEYADWMERIGLPRVTIPA